MDYWSTLSCAYVLRFYADVFTQSFYFSINEYTFIRNSTDALRHHLIIYVSLQPDNSTYLCYKRVQVVITCLKYYYNVQTSQCFINFFVKMTDGKFIDFDNLGNLSISTLIFRYGLHVIFQYITL